METLADVALSVRNGIFARRPTDDPRGSKILRISAVRGGCVNLCDAKFVAGLEPDQLERFTIKHEDLLITRYNGSRALVGTSGIVPIHEGDVVHPDKLIRVVINRERAEPRFINYQLQSPQVRHYLEPRIRTTAGQSGISGTDVRSVPIFLPPLTEQHRIVEVLEDHLSRLDAADESIGRSLLRLTALRNAILTDSVKQAQLSPGVGVTTIGSLARVSSGVTPLKSRRAYYEGGAIPWITSGDLHQGVITKATQFVTQTAVEETSLKVIPAGSILIAMYGEGKTRGTAAELGIEATTNQACAAIVLNNPELRRWVLLVLEANYQKLRHAAAGGVQPNLNLSIVKAIQIPLPTPDLRDKLIERHAELVAAETRMRLSLSSAKRRSAALRRSLLRAAFNGELVDQDPTDEPAEVALARIRDQPRPTRKRAPRRSPSRSES